jgi:hypothetical protein
MSDFEIVDPLVHLVMSLDTDSRKRLEVLLKRGSWWANAQSKHENRAPEDMLLRGRAISEAGLEISDILIGQAITLGTFK